MTGLYWWVCRYGGMEDISQRTLWQKYAKHVIEDPEEEVERLLEEAVLQSLVQSGMLTQVVMQQAVQDQMTQQAGDPEQSPPGTQARRTPTVPVEAQRSATEMEQISGQPGSMNIPQEVAQQGFAAATGGMAGIGSPTP